ncbi:MAG: DUF6516 family protein [Burkholderiales bacterium]
MTTILFVGILSNMKAVELLRRRIIYTGDAFAELVLWQLPRPARGSPHQYKYRLAYIVGNVCIIRYDNESGKGDHRHYDNAEKSYTFSTPEKLIADFQHDITRWNNENRSS